MRAMRRQVFGLLSLLLVAALPCCSQMMDPSEYRGFLKRLDASAAEWREHIEKLNVEQLNVTFPIGKRIEESKEICLRNLADLHAVIGGQLTTDMLSQDVSLSESLEDVSEMLGLILSDIPASEQSVQWARQLPSLDKEIASYRRTLRKHISTYANQLQLKAAKCPR
jgi:hypothetical protein